MIRKMIKRMLVASTIAIGTMWAASWAWPLWRSWSWDESVVNVDITEGAIDARYKCVNPGKTINYAYRGRFLGISWERRDDIITHGRWYIPGSRFWPYVGHGYLPPPDAKLSPASYRREYRVHIPYWIPFVLCSIPLLIIVGINRGRCYYRKIHGLCISCGYNLTGNQSGGCPECGTKIL